MKKVKINEAQYNIIIETARIQNFYKTDKDGNIVNPENPEQNMSVDFGKMRDKEDAKGMKHGESTKHLRQAVGLGAAEIDKVQKELTKSAQKRRREETGRNDNIIPYEELGVVSKSMKDKLKDGMELELKGKSFSYGNKKVPEDIMIINLTSAWNCPAAKAGECPFTEVCYARDEEGNAAIGKNLQLRNLRNQHMYKYLSGREILKLIETYIEQAPVRIRYIRISEDGDFPDQQTLDFCDKLAGHIKAKYGIQTAAYTHRQLNYSGVKNIIINASDYRIQGATRYFICTDSESWNNLPDGMSYDDNMQVPGVDTSNGVFKCKCDCRKCYFCYRTKEENGEPNEPLTVVEELRGTEEKVVKALNVKTNGERKSNLTIPACAVEVNQKKKVKK